VRTRAAIEAWIVAYERAWRSEGTDRLGEMFAAGASYRMSPYEEPVTGLDAIAALWEREREGPHERFEMRHEIVAVEGEVAVVRVAVEYGNGLEYRDLWILRFDAEGRCREFEEWPFWPGQQIVAEGGNE